MKSLAFPNMLSSSTARVLSNDDATMSNLRLLLASVKKTLFGDPSFGSNLLSLMFELNSTLLVDIVKDEIYSCINEYMPQLSLTRDNILLITDRTNVIVNMKVINKLNGEASLYSIKLINEE